MSPKGGQSVQEGPITFIWKPECLRDASKIDIYLYSQQQQSAIIPIHAWTGIKAASNHVNVSLDSRWWNSTKEAKMNIQIVDSGHQPWDTNHPISHTWTVTDPGGNSNGNGKSFDIVGMGLITDFGGSTGLSKGALAAAVICPIIATLIILVGTFIFVHRWRRDKRIKEREEMRARSVYSSSMTPQSTPHMASSFYADPTYAYDHSSSIDPGYATPQFATHDVEAVAVPEHKESEHESLKSLSENASSSGTDTGASNLRHKPPSDRSRSNPSRLDKWDSDFWYMQGSEDTALSEGRRSRGTRDSSKKSGDRRRERRRVKRKDSGPVDQEAVEQAARPRSSRKQQRPTPAAPAVTQDAVQSEIAPEYGPSYEELSRVQAPKTITSNVPASLLGPRVIPEPDWAPEPTGKAERDAKIAAFLEKLPGPGESYDGDTVSRYGGTTHTSMHSAVSDAASISEFADAATHAHEE